MAVDFTTAAIRYAGLGWHVLPLAALSKEPAISKAVGGHGVHDAATASDTIEAWGRRWPNANIGIACGEMSGIVVIDVDPRNGGDVTMRTLAAQGHAFPKLPKARTGNGGWHLFLAWQSGVKNSAKRLGTGVDVKSTGGYVVAAPSQTRASAQGPGGRYLWEVSPFEVQPPRMPQWLLQKLVPQPKPSPQFDVPFAGDIDGLVRFVQRAIKGERNNHLFWAACRARELITRGLVSEATTVSALLNAAVSAGLDFPRALRTIQTGLHGAASAGGQE